MKELKNKKDKIKFKLKKNSSCQKEVLVNIKLI